MPRQWNRGEVKRDRLNPKCLKCGYEMVFMSNAQIPGEDYIEVTKHHCPTCDLTMVEGRVLRIVEHQASEYANIEPSELAAAIADA